MAKSVVSYDKDLPEIPGRCPWLAPESHLVKDATAPTGWREEPGRRASNLLLVTQIRATVDAWRTAGYPGASAVSRRLFEYWFDEDHRIEGFPVPFRYHFCQREAIETLVYLVEIWGIRDAMALIQTFASATRVGMFNEPPEFTTTMDGRRQVRRYVAELEALGTQELPPVDLRRYAVKMATGAGKTWVMAMAMVWSYFHRRKVAGSDLSCNFLVIAPNVIVYQRLERDFANNAVFHQLPLIPPEWKGTWSQKVVLRGEAGEPDPGGTLFLTNIQQLYETRRHDWTPQNAVDALLGPEPSADMNVGRSLLDRIRGLRDLVVLNDEAHHVHDSELAWTQTLLSIHQTLPKGLALWLDFSATPKDQSGMYFPWTVCDYPLAQVVEDRIVKAPLIVTRDDDKAQPTHDPDAVTKDNVHEKYAYWLAAAMKRWKEHHATYTKLGRKPVLFIMLEKNVFADAVGDYLRREYKLKQDEVLVIHTDAQGEITKGDLDRAREAARDIDNDRSPVKVIVSVMMLREGWDVRNVSVVLGLRPFSAKAQILPEQVIGRGLRLMSGVGNDRTQTVEVLGTRNLLQVLRAQLEAEGVGVGTTSGDPPRPIIIEPVQERSQYDIALPMTKPRLIHNVRKIGTLDPTSFEPIYDQPELEEIPRLTLRMEFATTETEVHQDEIQIAETPFAGALLERIVNLVMQKARLTGNFAQLVPIVRGYLRRRCFGRIVNLDDESIRRYLNQYEIREGIAKYLARKISELTIEKTELRFENASFTLAQTKPFSWRRNLPPLTVKHTIFNHVATYNHFERKFAVFLDDAKDVLRFASLGTTEQGDSNTQFRVDYLKPSGAIGFYHPDWVVVQEADGAEVNWIIETKGRVWESTDVKDAAMDDWCETISEQTGQAWRFARINQADFERQVPTTLAQAVAPPDDRQRRLLD
jgi:type III restriction enzyme